MSVQVGPAFFMWHLTLLYGLLRRHLKAAWLIPRVSVQERQQRVWQLLWVCRTLSITSTLRISR